MKIDLNQLAFNQPMVNLSNEEWNKLLVNWSIICAERVFSTWCVDKEPDLIDDIDSYMNLIKTAGTDTCNSPKVIAYNKYMHDKYKKREYYPRTGISTFIICPAAYHFSHMIKTEHESTYSLANLNRLKNTQPEVHNTLINNIKYGRHTSTLKDRLNYCDLSARRQGHGLALNAPHYGTERVTQMINLVHLIQENK